VKILVGLGNPGANYERTRHNAGFRLVDSLAAREGLRFKRKLTVPAWLGSFDSGGERVFVAKPKTFMNRSGTAVAGLLRKYGLEVSDLVVIYDDVALPLGQLRLRASGGAGGHNGLRSIIDALGSQDFLRIRIGVDGPRDGRGMIDHVLGRFAPNEEEIIKLAIESGLDMIDSLLRDGAEKTMSKFNRKIN
jgi:peptidyl-tRNA hydrolase, PTH1 family